MGKNRYAKTGFKADANKKYISIDMDEMFASLRDWPDSPGYFDTMPRRAIDNYTYKNKSGRSKGRKSRQRAEYSIELSDLWNFDTYLAPIMVASLRSIGTAEALELVDIILDIQDNHSMNSMAHFADKDEDDAERERFHKKSLEARTKAELNWGRLYLKVLEQSPRLEFPSADYLFDKDTVATLANRFNTPWSEWRGVYTDPTAAKIAELDKENPGVLAKHLHQRAKFGYSDVDLEFAPMQHVNWILLNGLTWFVSDSPMGYPGGETWEGSAENYKAHALAVVELIAKPGGFSEETVKSVNEMPNYLPGLWD